MELKRAKANGLVVSQIRDGVEFNYVEHEGTMYIPLLTVEQEKEVTARSVPAEDAPAVKTRGAKKTEKEAAPKPSANELDAVLKILNALDKGADLDKSISDAVSVLPGADEEAVKDLITEFNNNSDLDARDVAASLVALSGKATAPVVKTGRGSKAASDGLVSPESLKEGDKVSVWWGVDEEEGETYNEWFNGSVKSIRRGKVLIAYTDGSEEYLDSKLNTKIKLA